MASFQDQIRAHAGTGSFVSLGQEKHLLRLGTSGYGLDLERARGAVLEAAAADSLVLESAVEQGVGDYLQSQAGANGRVSRAVFNAAVDLYRARARGRVGPGQAASRVKEIMTRRGLAPRASGVVLRSRRWFNRIPRPAEEAGERTAALPTGIAVQAPVQATLDAWAAAFAARDVQGILALYAPDALLLATGAAEPLRGPAAMRGYFEKLVVAQSGTVQFGQTLAVDGVDPAVASGLYVFTWIDPVRGPVVTPARFTFVVTHGDGGTVGAFLQHHSSAVPQDGTSLGCPI